MDEYQDFDDMQMRPAHVIAKCGEGVAPPTNLVHLHHPGYEDDDESVMFTLPTCSMNGTGQPCSEYMVAWQGCYALAINEAGFFTKQKDRTSDRVRHGQGLTKGHYWYHLEREMGTNLYATLSEFRAWRYSPEAMPNSWHEAVPWRGCEDEDQEDGDCCITGEDGGVQKAHLVGRTEWQWWTENNMTDHAATSGLARAMESIGQETTVPGNLIFLSDGLHRLWDRNFFCLFPLRCTDRSMRLHCIFLQPLEKAVRNHHRRPLRGGLRHTSAACAWARFVSSICRKYDSTFLAKPVKRYLGGSKMKPEMMDASSILEKRQDRVRNTSPRKKSRSSSPRKRARSPSQDAFEREEEWEWGCGCSQKDSAIDFSSDESPDRGRMKSRVEEESREPRQERRKRRRLRARSMWTDQKAKEALLYD